MYLIKIFPIFLITSTVFSAACQSNQTIYTPENLVVVKSPADGIISKVLVNEGPKMEKDAPVVEIETNGETLNDFVRRNLDRIAIHILVFALFAGILMFFRRRAKPWIEKEPELKNICDYFSTPDFNRADSGDSRQFVDLSANAAIDGRDFRRDCARADDYYFAETRRTSALSDALFARRFLFY